LRKSPSPQPSPRWGEEYLSSRSLGAGGKGEGRMEEKAVSDKSKTLHHEGIIKESSG